MNTRLRRAFGVVVLAAALTAPTAHADDPIRTSIELAEDGAATVVDSALDVVRGCTPIVKSWTPKPLTFVPLTPTANGSIYYRETGGGTAHLSCAAPVLIRARISDDSVPAAYRSYRSVYSSLYVTSANPSRSASVAVPYFGPDAPIMRPFGHVVVHVEVFRRLSTGRYGPIRFGCMEWEYLLQPAASIVVDDPRKDQGACRYDAMYAVEDGLDGINGSER